MDSLLVVTINGGWVFPGFEYIWKRVRQELDKSKLEEG